MIKYVFDPCVRWIRYSGLPAMLNGLYGSVAWSIFYCLVSLDCRFSPESLAPDWFDQSYKEIADQTGLCTKTVSKYMELLKEHGLFSHIKGKHNGLKSSFKIASHIKTPIDPKSIAAANGGLFGRKGRPPNLRYYQRAKQMDPLEKDTKGEEGEPKGCKVEHERGQQVPDNKNDKEKIIIKREEDNTIQEQPVSSPLSQEGQETQSPTREKEWHEYKSTGRQHIKQLKTLFPRNVT